MITKREHLPLHSGEVMRLQQTVSAPISFLQEETSEAINFWALVKKYAFLCVAMIAAGALAGVGLIVLQTPIYKARILVEVQPLSQTVSQNGMDPFAAVFSMDTINMQTQVKLLNSGPFRRRVYEQMERMPAPPPPVATDVFSRLRMYLRPEAARQAVSQENALQMAAETFSVSVINETRLIELSCESPHPVITAAYLNNIAQAFIEDAIHNRGQASEATDAWLTRHIEETKSQLLDADARLRAFVLRSGNVFASSESTVDDVKLKDLQNQLAAAEVDELAKQAAYETAVKSSDYESLPQVVIDPIAAGLRSQIAELDRQKAALLVALTDKNPKVIALEDQRKDLEAALEREARSVIGRLRNEYDAAINKERLLIKAYAEESGQVTAQASKAAEYVALRRQTDDLQKRYDSLLGELSKTQLAQSAPVIPLRLVEPSIPPSSPSKPQPLTLMMLGIMAGMAGTVAAAFLKMKMDRAIESPESLQMLVRVPQLGVIPAANQLPKAPGARATTLLSAMQKSRMLPAASQTTVSGVDSGHVARLAWDEGSAVLADSFRAAVASINRHLGSKGESSIVLVTSSTVGAGKTTVLSNLGIALSEAGRRTLLIDADFRRPRLGRIFGCRLDLSLPAVLTSSRAINDYPLHELAAETPFPNLFVLPSQTPDTGVATLIYSDRFPQLLDRFQRSFDVILVDAPPILFPADARVIGRFCQAAVLVIRAGHCERQGIRAAAKFLHEDGVPILGTVLNGWTPMGPKSGMSYYSYSYYNQ